MRITCNCGKTLKVADSLAGKKIRCPACKEVFLAQEESPLQIESVVEEKAVAPPASIRKKPRTETREDLEEGDEREERERSRPRKNKGARKTSFLSRYGLILGVGGGVVVAAAIALVVFLPRGRTDDKKGGPGGQAPMTDEQKIQGTWEVVSAERDGQPASPEAFKNWSIAFKDNSMTIAFGQEGSGGDFTLNTKQNPRALYVVGNGRNAGFDTFAIYKFDGDALTLSWYQPSNGRRPMAFEAKPEGLNQVKVVLKRGKASPATVPDIKGSDTLTPDDETAALHLKIIVSNYLSVGQFLGRAPANMLEFMDAMDPLTAKQIDFSRYEIIWNIDLYSNARGTPRAVAYEKRCPTSGGMVGYTDFTKKTKVSAEEFKKLGIGPSNNKPPSESQFEVAVLMGGGLGRLQGAKPGKVVRISAELIEETSKGNVVHLHVGSVYDGPEPAVKAEDLTRDFATNRDAALKKYKGKLVIEGAIKALLPVGSGTLVLYGH